MPPLHFRGGDLNLYRYVKNTPINNYDPTGEKYIYKFPYSDLMQDIGKKCKRPCKSQLSKLAAKNRGVEFFLAAGGTISELKKHLNKSGRCPKRGGINRPCRQGQPTNIPGDIELGIDPRTCIGSCIARHELVHAKQCLTGDWFRLPVEKLEQEAYKETADCYMEWANKP